MQEILMRGDNYEREEEECKREAIKGNKRQDETREGGDEVTNECT